jgi:hypothetical protein
MKRLIMIVSLLLACAGFSIAQTTPAKKDVAKKETKAVKAAPAKKSEVATKKDGTPDMRYKANKVAADTTKHMTKKGTPDKRYKENKKP